MFRNKMLLGFTVSIVSVMLFASTGFGLDLKIAFTQAKSGDIRKYQPLVPYLAKKGITVTFITTQDYASAGDLFASGSVSAMFCGSGIAGTMIMKNLADPLVRPVSANGISTYSAAIIALKGSPAFTGSGAYFNGKLVIFAQSASAGEFYFHSLGASTPREIMKTPNHGVALEALGRGGADIAIIKNHVWTAEKAKYPQLELVGQDKEVYPEGTLIIARTLKPAAAKKISDALLSIKNDSSPEALAVKESMQMTEFIPTTVADFNDTLAMLKRAKVTKDFNFKF